MSKEIIEVTDDFLDNINKILSESLKENEQLRKDFEKQKKWIEDKNY